jgi:hypothetical protein
MVHAWAAGELLLLGQLAVDEKSNEITAGAALRLKAIDEIDDVEESAARPAANAGTCDGNGKMSLARSRSADENNVALPAIKLPPARSRELYTFANFAHHENT